MKVAVVRNTPEAGVLQPLGRKNREYYRESDIEAVRDALVEAGHAARIFEGDVDLIPALKEFFNYREPADLRDAFVFNLAYGVQGECRYTQIPSLLELVGLPYVGSGPRAHTVALDKFLAKVVFEQAGLPTPAYQLMASAEESRRPELAFPLIVKPQFESTSFGVAVVHSDEELAGAVAAILEEFSQPALVEAFIDGIEVNCGVLGNSPPQALPVLEVDFGGKRGADAILSFEVKRDRVATHVCPARIPDAVARRVQELSVAAFAAIGCNDAARVDFRIDEESKPYVLELNSMVAIHSSGSFFHAAQAQGMTYGELVNRVFDAAVARYVGRG